MDSKLDVKGASLYRLAQVTLSWCHRTKDGTCLKRGRPWTDSRYLSLDLNKYEIYTYIHKDKQTKTYWLVDNKILKGTGKEGSVSTIEYTPLYQVELIKEHPDDPEYWIVERKNWPS